ncbi:MAG: hypothetical protein ACP5RT_01320 [Candidatus Micrarchaeia archaeon]
MKDKNNVTQMQKTTYACPFCGNIFYTYETDGAICPSCNLFTDKLPKDLEADLSFNEIKEVNFALSQMKDCDLNNITEKAIAKKDPYYMYGVAILNLRLSDIKHRSKNYTLGGFMESNSNEEEKSHELYSIAKAIFFDAIALCRKNEDKDQELYYIEFLSLLALNDIDEAGMAIENVRKNEKIKKIVTFANLLYAITIGDKNAKKYIQTSIDLGQIAAYYELGRLYAKMGRLNEARKILNELVSNSVAMPRSRILLEKIEKQLVD